MKEQPQRTLLDATIETQRSLAALVYTVGFHLIFQVGEEEEDIRVWVERPNQSQYASYLIQRSVQRYPPGHVEAGRVAITTIAEVVLAEDADRFLTELLYLWTRDAQVNALLHSLLEQNLRHLRTRERGLRRDDAFASAVIYMYDVLFDDDEGSTGGEIFRFMGKVSTKAELRQLVLELPSSCHSFDIHLEVFDRITGNAGYRVGHEIDPQTGKRAMLLIEHEFGACEAIHKCFSDLYNTEEEFNRYVGLA